MLSLTRFYRYFWQVFLLCKADGFETKVFYKGKVFIINIEPTGETYKPQRYIRKARIKKKGIPLVTEDCLVCGSIVLGNICINANCETNKKKEPVKAP